MLTLRVLNLILFSHFVSLNAHVAVAASKSIDGIVIPEGSVVMEWRVTKDCRVTDFQVIERIGDPKFVKEIEIKAKKMFTWMYGNPTVIKDVDFELDNTLELDGIQGKDQENKSTSVKMHNLWKKKIRLPDLSENDRYLVCYIGREIEPSWEIVTSLSNGLEIKTKALTEKEVLSLPKFKMGLRFTNEEP